MSGDLDPSILGQFQRSFLEGFVDGVYDQVQGFKDEQLPSPMERALVLYNVKLQTYLNVVFGGETEMSLCEDEGNIDAVKNLGYVHGKKVSLHPQVEDQRGHEIAALHPTKPSSFFKRLIGE